MPSRSVFVVDWALNLPCIVLYCITLSNIIYLLIHPAAFVSSMLYHVLIES